jgi:thiamine monophosphate synthase
MVKSTFTQSGMMLCLSAKNLSKTDYCHLAQQVAQLCSQHQVSLMLHTHADLLSQIPSAVGVHLPFKELILQESVLIEGQVGKPHKKYLAVSCHNKGIRDGMAIRCRFCHLITR